MKNINLLHPHSFYQHLALRNNVLCLIAICMLPLCVIYFVATILTAEKLALTKQRMALEKSTSVDDKIDFQNMIQSQIQDLTLIAKTISPTIVLQDIKYDNHILLLQGSAENASKVMIWVETLKEQFPPGYQIKINAIKKSSSSFFNFELQVKP